MSTVEAFVEAARAEIGTTESPAGSNRNKYSTSLGRPAQPWCADFIVWVARQVGLKLASESAYTPAMANGFRGDKSYVDNRLGGRRGDVCFFDFPDSKNRIQHVGIVIDRNDRTVTCIEGNTSAGSAGSQDNGGGVFVRTRPLTHVVGYGRPRFATQRQEDVMTADQQRILQECRNALQALVDTEDDEEKILNDKVLPALERIESRLDRLEAKPSPQPAPAPSSGRQPRNFGSST